MLCLATMTAGIVHLRSTPEPSSAVRVGSSDGWFPAPSPQPPPEVQVAAPGPISLAELARELQTRQATSTTRARPTTTVKKAPATTTSVPATTTTSAIPPPAPATTTTAPATTTTALVETLTPPLAAAAGAVTRSDSGIASWFGAPEATCAHRTLPMGTMIKVTRLHNGATATCKVDDRGPTLETGRLIDLSLDTFEKLAPRELGLIDVKIEW